MSQHRYLRDDQIERAIEVITWYEPDTKMRDAFTAFFLAACAGRELNMSSAVAWLSKHYPNDMAYILGEPDEDL